MTLPRPEPPLPTLLLVRNVNTSTVPTQDVAVSRRDQCCSITGCVDVVLFSSIVQNFSRFRFHCEENLVDFCQKVFNNISSLFISPATPTKRNVTNKSSSTAGAVQVQANLLEQVNDHLHFRKLKCC